MMAHDWKPLAGTSHHLARWGNLSFQSPVPAMACILAVLLTLLLLTGLASVSAEEPAEDTAGEDPQSSLLLEPGDHLIGWIGAAKPVRELFGEFPEIQLIYRWNPDARRYDYALARAGHESGLHQLSPGMAVMVYLGGEEGIEWNRAREPVRGLVELAHGTNWAAWSGPDGWSVTQVALGIGRSLVELRVGDAVYDPERPETADGFPPIMRGDALTVTVDRAVNWLQPTYLMPVIAFPGGVSAGLERQVREDVAATIEFYGDRYGIQADTSDFKIVVPKSFESFVDWLRDQGARDADTSGLRIRWDGIGAWVDENLIVQQTWWTSKGDGEFASSRYFMTHEYAHVLQDQLRHTFRTPSWMNEGSATWAGTQHSVIEGEISLAEARRAWYEPATDPDAPVLDQTGFGSGDLALSAGNARD